MSPGRKKPKSSNHLKPMSPNTMPPSTTQTIGDVKEESPEIKITSSASTDAADLPVLRKRPFDEAFAHEQSPDLGNGHSLDAPERDSMSAVIGDIGMRVASLVTGSFGSSTDGRDPSGQVMELRRQLNYQKGFTEHLVQQAKRSAKRLADEKKEHKKTSLANDGLETKVEELQAQLMEADDLLELRIAEITQEMGDAKKASSRTEDRLLEIIKEKDTEMVSLRSKLRKAKGQARELKRTVEVIQDVVKDGMQNVEK